MQKISYQVIRSNRRSIALLVDPNANLIVRAPFQVEDSVIADFVQKKRHWIKKRQEEITSFDQQNPPIQIVTGGHMIYLGNNYTVIKAATADITRSGHEIRIPEHYELPHIVLWLKQEALRIIEERVRHYSRIMNVTPRKVKLSGARTRWGSCSSLNNLNFTWRLIFCPLSAIDYVVVHELSHILHKNHSPAFWACVKSILPNYKAKHDWFKANRKLLDLL